MGMAIFPLERGRSLSSRDLLPDVKLSNEQPSGKLLEKTAIATLFVA